MIVSSISAVLFDLDGTLVDTAPDIAFALNALLQEQDKFTLPYDKIRANVSHGSQALLALAFDISPDHTDYPILQQRLYQLYQYNIARNTCLFAGMEAVLSTLEQRSIPWGVITNKPALLTELLLAKLNLLDRAVCVVSGDTTAFCKPHPAPMIHACNLIKKKPEQCVYIGDTASDMKAGKGVNMQTVAALYGYLSEDDHPQNWQADATISAPKDILQWI